MGDIARALRRHWLSAGAAVVLGGAAALCGVGLMATAAWLISRAATRPPVLELSVAAVAVRALALGRSVLRYAERLLSHDVALRFLADVRVRFFERLEPLVPAQLGGSRPGDLLARFAVDVDSLQDVLLRVVMPLAAAAMVLAVAVAIEATILPAAGLLLLLGLLLTVVLVPCMALWADRRGRMALADARAELHALSIDLSWGLPELLIDGAHERWAQRADEAARAVARIERRTAIASGMAAALSLLCAGATLALIAQRAATAVEAGAVRSELVAVLLLLALAAFEPVGGVASACLRAGAVRAAARRLQWVTGMEPAIADGEGGRLPPATVPLDVASLSVGYPQSASLVLEDVSFHLEPGQSLAVVGPSGAGKTTLALALVRFLPWRAGSVRLGGCDLSTVPLDDLHRHVVLVAEDAFVFGASVRDNLRLGKPEVDDRQLDAMAARLDLTAWVASLPHGWSTVLASGGGELSGGQRRRLVLARALLAAPKVLIVDEPTAGLDGALADRVTSELLGDPERITVVITHREDDLHRFDHVLRLGPRMGAEATARSLVDAPSLIGAPECGHASQATRDREDAPGRQGRGGDARADS